GQHARAQPRGGDAALPALALHAGGRRARAPREPLRLAGRPRGGSHRTRDRLRERRRLARRGREVRRALELFARRVLLVPVAAVRPYLILKCTLLVVAFDVWLTRISHGGRYGAGGFNVAHFAWLDAIQPEVSPALYVGVCTLTGL